VEEGGLVLVDDYSKYTWVFFLVYNNESSKMFEVFYKRVHMKKDFYISSIRSDHGTRFKSKRFKMFCESRSIHHNEVVERNNVTRQEMI